MRRLLFLLFSFSSFAAFSQTHPLPINRSPSSVIAKDANLKVTRGFALPVVPDTATALTYGWDSLGMIIQIRTTGAQYKRDTVLTGGHVWTPIGSGGGGSVNTSVGAKIAVAITGTNNVKSLDTAWGTKLDSTSVTNVVKIGADSQSVASKNYVGKIRDSLGGNKLSTISTTNSVQGNGTPASPVQLAGDNSTPAPSSYYGTNGSGAKGYYSLPSGVAAANPTAQVGVTPVNGSATTFMRSDAAPSLDTTGAKIHTQGYNDVRYRKSWLDSLYAGLILDTTKVFYYGTGDTLLRASANALRSALIRDSLAVHIRINPDSSLTFYTSLFTNTLSGTVPASGGGTTNFLRADGTWAAPAGGGSTPTLDQVLGAGPISAKDAQVGGFKSTNGDTVTVPSSNTFDRVVTEDTTTHKRYHRQMQLVDLTGIADGNIVVWSASAGNFTTTAPPLVLNGTGYVKMTGTTPAYRTNTQLTSDINTFTASLNGSVPAPGGSPTGSKVLADNGTWVTAGGSSLATASGDATGTVSGTNLPLSVVKIQGTPVSSAAPTIGQIQVYDPGTGQYNPTNGGYLIGDTTMKLSNAAYHDGIQAGGKTLNGLGDSWTFGSGASSPTTTSYLPVLCGAVGATMGQYGTAGMTLETDGTGNNYQGVPSIIQRLSTIPNSSSSTAGIIAEFGLNDLPPVGSYTLTHFAAAYDTLLRHIIDTCHYKRRQVVIMGLPWIPDAALTYYGTISGGTAPTRARLLQFDSVVQAVAMKWGVWYVPTYYQLKDNMNDSTHYTTTGSLHLDDVGHKFYAYNIIQKLSLQTGSPWSQSGSTIQAVTTPANVNLSTSGTGVSTSTPNFVDWGDRYGNTEGPSQLKAIFYNDGTVNNRFGVGVFSGKMLIHAGGASTTMDFWIGGSQYMSLSTSALTLNGATQNKLQFRNTTSSGVATPDQNNLGGTFFNSSVFDSSKTKYTWYQSGSSAFGGVGINTLGSYFVTPHGFPYYMMYDNTQALVVSKTIKLGNYGSGTNTGTAAFALNVDASGNIIEGTVGGGSGYATIQNNTSSVTARTKINFPSASGGPQLTATDNSGNGSTDITISNLTSGMYVPAITTPNSTAGTLSADSALYTRIGNIVTVSGAFTATPSASSSSTTIIMTLPIASLLNGGHACWGTANTIANQVFGGSSGNVSNASTQGVVSGNASNHQVQVFWVSNSTTGATTFNYTYQYQIQ